MTPLPVQPPDAPSPALRLVVLGVSGMLALVIACSGPARDNMLRVLFNDPPVHDSLSVAADTVKATAQEIADAEAEAMRAAIRENEKYKHPPYEDGECGDCHSVSTSASFRPAFSGEQSNESYDDRTGARLIAPREKLCYECHDDMTPEELASVGEYLHSPAEEGECLECHNPHASRFPKMLRKGDPFEELCFQCHDLEDIIDIEPHDQRTPEMQRCITCHDPHVSQREYLLKPGAGLLPPEDEE